MHTYLRDYIVLIMYGYYTQKMHGYCTDLGSEKKVVMYSTPESVYICI